MKKVKVTIKPDVARRGCGYYDVVAGQDIVPPRNKEGKPVIDHVFTVERTPFVERKIQTGELIVIESVRNKSKIPVIVNEKEISQVVVEGNLTDAEVRELVIADKKFQKACGDRGIVSMEITDEGFVVKVK